MRRMQALACVLAFLWAGSLLAADTADMMTKALETKKSGQAIKEQRDAALGGLPKQRNTLAQQVAAAGGAASPQALQQKQAHVERLRAELKAAEAELAAMQVSDPTERQKKAAEAQAELDRVQAEMRIKGQPFEDQMQALRRQTDADRQAMFDLLQQHMRDLGPPYNLKAGRVSGDYTDGFYAVHWEDAAGKNQVWTHIRLEPDTEAKFAQDKLDGKYPVTSNSNQSVWFKAGHFLIVVHVNNKEWHGRESVDGLAKAMFDLAGLAALKPR